MRRQPQPGHVLRTRCSRGSEEKRRRSWTFLGAVQIIFKLPVIFWTMTSPWGYPAMIGTNEGSTPETVVVFAAFSTAVWVGAFFGFRVFRHCFPFAFLIAANFAFNA